MEQEQIAFFSYISGGILFAALFFVTLYLWRIKAAHITLSIAALISMTWHLAIAMNYRNIPLDSTDLLILEVCRYGAWITALLAALKYSTGQHLPNKLRYLIHGLWLIALVTILLLRGYEHPSIENTNSLIWSSLVLSITSLICVEQLYKNSSYSRLMKLWSLIAGAIFAYDIYLFSYSLVFDQIDAELWQARGAINGIAALMLALGSLSLSKQATQKAKFAFSRPVAFYTTSMTVAGSFLSLMAVGGYYVQLYGGSWGTIIQILVLFLAILSISIVFISRTIRSRLDVWINKNFFRHKYDYRTEWLQLINYLSRTPDIQDFQLRAITAVASIFKSSQGALWLQQKQHFVPVATLNLNLPEGNIEERVNTPFCQALREREWVFSPYTQGNKDQDVQNQVLPKWIFEIPNLWLVLPLLVEQDLLGFMVLTKPRSQDASLTWEDLDLLKNVGRQVASYLDRQHAADVIAESRQFDAFNKLTAFIMHDLKNLIAQQALVVENAAKHKENPAFVEDAISTIDNSVARMNTLLKKLQHNEPTELRSLELHKTLMEATKKCQNLQPIPTLRLESSDIVVTTDPDHLLMTCIHIIKNAQEATYSSGFVDVTLRREGKNAIITIEDNGDGMDEEFIRNQLFKPFVTTKSGKGMGIGVYQAKEFITSLGGKVFVESSPGLGTTFTISIPATQG
ncbi:MAG: XrtA/PEP-CTERM system histidine kinase PrsK [Pseudomonadales bacterium]